MRLVAKVKLLPTDEQHGALLDTLEVTNAACNHISQQAYSAKVFRQFGLHKLVYYDVRETFKLSAQMVVRAIGKVADAYKISRKKQRGFKKQGAIAYDNRVLAWKIDQQTVSIWTTAGRQTMPFACGERALELLQSQRGETDLCFVRGTFYLFTPCDVETPEPIDVEGVLGVDRGIVNIAVDSDGDIHAGNHINNVRHRHRRLRTKLQKKGTRSARRRLQKLSGKESRFAKDVNHCISKKIVAKAKDTGRAIALEQLAGISNRVTVRRPQRATLKSWSFFQLRQFIEYKSERAGIPVVFVDPRNTSRTCPECGCIDKRNRPAQSIFSCVSCGFSGHADTIAAGNIASRAIVNWPNVSDAVLLNPSIVTAGTVAPGTSSPALAGSR